MQKITSINFLSQKEKNVKSYFEWHFKWTYGFLLFLNTMVKGYSGHIIQKLNMWYAAVLLSLYSKADAVFEDEQQINANQMSDKEQLQIMQI